MSGGEGSSVRRACPRFVRAWIRAGAAALMRSVGSCLRCWPFAARCFVAAWLFLPVLPAALAGGSAVPEMAPSAAQGSGDFPDVSRALVNRIEARWWRLKGVEARGDRAAAVRAAGDLRSLLDDEGVARFEALGLAAAIAGQTAVEDGRPTVAVSVFQLSRELDPYSARGWWGEASVKWHGGRRMEGLSLFLRALRVRWRSFWVRLADVVNLAVILLGGLLLSGAVAVLVLLLKHGPELAREIDDRLPGRWHPMWRTTIGWVVLLAPLALLIFGAWSLLFWVVLLAPACNGRERGLLYAFLVLLALSVPAMGGLRLLTTVAASKPAQVGIAATEGALRADLVEGLTELSAAHPEVALWKIQLARWFAPSHPDLALPLLREARQLTPGDPRVRILLGNVLFRVGKYEAAGVHYRKALELDEENLLARFNLARVQLAVFAFDEADELLVDARKLALDRVRELEAQTGEDDVADPRFLVSEAVTEIVRHEIRPHLRRVISPVNPLTLMALGALIGAWVLRLRTGAIDSHRCETCGKAAGARRGDLTETGVCTACHHLFSRREGLAPAARKEQARRIENYLSSLSRERNLSHVFWPGLGLIHEGRVWLGWLMASLWAILFLGAFLPQRLLPPPAFALLWRPGLLCLIFAALVWILCQFPFLRPRPVDRRGGR